MLVTSLHERRNIKDVSALERQISNNKKKAELFRQNHAANLKQSKRKLSDSIQTILDNDRKPTAYTRNVSSKILLLQANAVRSESEKSAAMRNRTESCRLDQALDHITIEQHIFNRKLEKEHQLVRAHSAKFFSDVERRRKSLDSLMSRLPSNRPPSSVSLQNAEKQTNNNRNSSSKAGNKTTDKDDGATFTMSRSMSRNTHSEFDDGSVFESPQNVAHYIRQVKRPKSTYTEPRSAKSADENKSDFEEEVPKSVRRVSIAYFKQPHLKNRPASVPQQLPSYPSGNMAQLKRELSAIRKRRVSASAVMFSQSRLLERERGVMSALEPRIKLLCEQMKELSVHNQKVKSEPISPKGNIKNSLDLSKHYHFG